MLQTRTVVIALMTALTLGACREAKSTRWDEKATEVKKGLQPKVDKSTVEKGGSLNAFFPKEGGGLSRTFTQEKLGFAEAELVQAGKTAKASISDTNNLPTARKKFDSAAEQVAGFPMVTVGSKQTAVLVNGRWQVKVSSSAIDAAGRKALIGTFDLGGLADFQGKTP